MKTTTLALLAPFLAGAPAFAETITLAPVADNTLYEPNFKGEASNGSGPHVYAGATRDGSLRRALLRFDFSEIPAGSTITGVSLQLVCTRQIVGSPNMTLHSVLSSWGEAASNAGEPGGAGTAPAPGDATWTFRFFQTDATWANPGGDFDPAVLAQTTVSLTGPYVWSGPALVSAVQSWVDGNAEHHGFMLRGDEATTFNAKRFGSRENPIPAERPALTITFTPPPSPLCPGDADGNDSVNFADITAVLANFLTDYSPSLNGPGDANHDGVVNFADVTAVLSNFNIPCT
ncbi:MAG: DNRLRE domain-containing protein [Planctomycetota bacterium]|nr:DNRLRE domain-containing protein [Planctomycetota bacterium]